MLQKAVLSLVIFSLVISVGCKIQEIEPAPSGDAPTTELIHAKPYVVLGEGNIVNEKEDRIVGLWFIVSEDATIYEEYAQTSIQAVRDLYRLYKRDFTSVLLIPNDKLKYAVHYAEANYAADGKGAQGMTGSAPATDWYWAVRAADRPLSERQLAIAELWFEKIPDFPSKDLLSSLSYDEAALRQYVADTLNTPDTAVSFPQMSYREYDYDERL